MHCELNSDQRHFNYRVLNTLPMLLVELRFTMLVGVQTLPT